MSSNVIFILQILMTCFLSFSLTHSVIANENNEVGDQCASSFKANEISRVKSWYRLSSKVSYTYSKNIELKNNKGEIVFLKGNDQLDTTKEPIQLEGGFQLLVSLADRVYHLIDSDLNYISRLYITADIEYFKSHLFIYNPPYEQAIIVNTHINIVFGQHLFDEVLVYQNSALIRHKLDGFKLIKSVLQLDESTLAYVSNDIDPITNEKNIALGTIDLKDGVLIGDQQLVRKPTRITQIEKGYSDESGHYYFVVGLDGVKARSESDVMDELYLMAALGRLGTLVDQRSDNILGVPARTVVASFYDGKVSLKHFNIIENTD